MKREKAVQIDKSYVPKIGDILCNGAHPLIIIQNVYYLDKISYRVDKSYNLQLIKHEALKKIIRRKEIIWSQHKEDLRLFPEAEDKVYPNNMDTSNRKDPNLNFWTYLYHNDRHQCRRLYHSRYSSIPSRKIRVIIGKKTMVTVGHGLCKTFVKNIDGTIDMYKCYHWDGYGSNPLSALVTQGFKYIGNIYYDYLEENN